MNIFKKIFRSKKGSELASKIMVAAFAVAMGGAVIVWTSNVIIEAKNKQINGVLDGSGEVTDGFIAASQGTEGLEYSIANRTYMYRLRVIGYTGSSTAVVVPSTDGNQGSTGKKDENGNKIYRDTVVESIWTSAFEDCTHVTSVTLPSSIKSIAASAFFNCTSLSSINIPNSVTDLGDNAFGDCSSLTSIYIPSTVEYIGADCFDGCSSSLVIHCAHASQPEGFGGNWDGGHQVVWGA